MDLTTVNQAVRSTGASRHKRLNELTGPVASKKQKVSDKSKENGDAATFIDPEIAVANSETPAADLTGSISQEVTTKSIQILDLPSGNPIAAYGGEVFSCKWTDMIGTTMFLAHPQEVPLYESELATADYDLIGTSRIKLVGTKTKLTSSHQSSTESGHSLGTIRRNNARVNADLRKQASFLEQLMNIKKDRGESDNVFVAMSNDIAAAVATGRLSRTAEAQKQKIENLNREAVKGNADALKQIEQIYLTQDVNDMDEEQTSASTQKPPNSHARHRISRRPRVLGTASPSPEPTRMPDIPL